MQCRKISRKKHGVAKSSIFSARGAICCRALSLFFQRATSSALLVSSLSSHRKCPLERRFERAEDDLGVEWRRRGVSDSSFVPSSRRIRLQITLAMIPCIFQISKENCRDLVAMDCIRYEESIYCRKPMSRISHICCNVSLTWLRAVKRPWSV